MQQPGWLDLDCYQGASFDYTLTWKTNGTAVNLTGYSARMQVRQTADATATVLSISNGSGITLGGTAGTVLLEASATTTAALTAGQYVYDLELVSGSYVTRLVEGNFVIYSEVTR